MILQIFHGSEPDPIDHDFLLFQEFKIVKLSLKYESIVFQRTLREIIGLKDKLLALRFG